MTGAESRGVKSYSDVRDFYAYAIGETKIVDGEGVFVRDSDGNEYLDCASGTFNLSLGYKHPSIAQTLHDNADHLLHVSSAFQTDPVNDLVTKLIEVSPSNIKRVHLKVCSGSTANEGAIKMAQGFNGGRDIISMFRSHHGQSMAMTAISGNAFRRQSFPDFPIGRLVVPDPYCRRCFYNQKRESCGLLCVNRIDDFIEFASSGNIACLIVEPISGNGGNITPPVGYLTKLQNFCKERSISLIFDEIQTGIGRTGSIFAAQHYGVEPDIITIGKGLGSGAQVAAILSTEELGHLEAESSSSFTYGANVLAAAIANTTLDVISSEGFLDNVKTVGTHLFDRLVDIERRYMQIDDIRGVGLMIGFEVVDAKGEPDVRLTNEIATSAKNFGLLLRTSRYGRGNVIKIRPPLIITIEETDLLCDRLEKLLASTLS